MPAGKDELIPIPLHAVRMPDAAESRIAEVLHSGYIADGAEVRTFERELRIRIGNENIETAGDYSAAILIALYQAGVRPGDEVIACPEACLGTNMPILNLFARPVWCDFDPRTGNIDVTDVARHVTSKTKAILYTHWGGDIAPIDELNGLARELGLRTIEDASEAFGAEYRGTPLGTHGSDYTIWSFGPVRHITTGEGAAVAFADPNEAERFRWLKRYGINQPTFRGEDGEINASSDIPEPGLNSYLNNIGAAIGLQQLAEVQSVIDRHRENGKYFETALRGIDGLRLLDKPTDAVSGYWVYTALADRRDDLMRALRGDGIRASKLHLRNDSYSCFGTGLADLPGVAEFSAKRICLPCGWWLSAGDRERITSRIRAGW